MIDVATLSVIRRWALREQMSIREISRRTGLARNTVKKYLRAGDDEPRYARRASSSKLDPYAEKLSTWLADDGEALAGSVGAVSKYACRERPCGCHAGRVPLHPG